MKEKIDIPTLSRRLCELARIPWHEIVHTWGNYYTCSCSTATLHESALGDHVNPNFRNPVEVLKVMRPREDWWEFVFWLWGQTTTRECVYDIMLDKTGLLLAEAVEFLEERKG